MPYTGGMTLSAFTAATRERLWAAVEKGLPPPEGSFSQERLQEGKDKGGKPQIGATRYEPDAVHFEFIYPVTNGAPVLLSVRVEPPERIVFMPVPDWVVASIWQGDVTGTFRFESEAEAMLKEFRERLSPERNAREMAEPVAIGRS
jgi:hypothetical protein